MTIETNSPEETFALGQKLGEQAKAGQIYTLNGDLGVGKTVFTQGIARGLGITEAVSSPTFTIVQVYEEGRLPFYHFDVYRIGDIEEMEEIGYDDYFFGNGVCMIEWADHELVTVSRQKAIAVEELIRELNALGEAVIFLGDGVTVYQEMLKENMQVPYSFAPAHLNKQRAGAVGALAEKYYREGKTVTAAEHQPEYLRVSQAERERAEREAGKK